LRLSFWRGLGLSAPFFAPAQAEPIHFVRFAAVLRGGFRDLRV
jgi:hypothetical protein